MDGGRQTTQAKQGVLRTVVSVALKLVVTTAVLLFVVHKLGWQRILSTAASASPVWLAAAALAFFVSVVLGVVQWQILLRNRGITLSFGTAFRLYFIGIFFNNFILGMIAGDAVRVTYLKLGNESARAGFAATFLDRFAGFWAMSAFAVIASVWLVGSRGVGPGLWYTVAALAGAFVLFGGVMALLVVKPVQRLAYAVLERLPIPQKTRVRGVVEEMVLEAHDSHIIVPVALVSIAVQALRVGVHILCAASMGMVSAATLHYFFIFVPLLAMTMVVPLPFGVREAVEGSLFAMAGFRAESAVVMGFLASIVGITVSLLGAVYFVTGRAQRRKAGQ